MIDNHIHQGNALDIDVTNIVWKRVVDMNDRALRHVVVGMGGKVNGIPREVSAHNFEELMPQGVKSSRQRLPAYCHAWKKKSLLNVKQRTETSVLYMCI